MSKKKVRETQVKNIGMALSGGGIRAMLFHLGLFEWMAENGLFEQVKKVSTVSGASLCVGMIYSHNNLNWPTSNDFLSKTLPSIKQALKADLQTSAICRLITSPCYWNKKVNIIARTLEHTWGIYGEMAQLSGDAIWYINCTSFETGKRFRFSRENMGDYIIGYVENPKFSIAEAMAASAGFPMFIGPYVINTRKFTWTPSRHVDKRYSHHIYKTLHLWDGGIYDNLGLESVYKPDNGGELGDGLEFLIVSNASAPIGIQARTKWLFHRNIKRVLDISLEQVAAVRTRGVMEFIKTTGQGMYLKIGNSAAMITEKSSYPDELRPRLTDCCLSEEQTNYIMKYPTTLKKPNDSDFQMLLRHGYEVANCTFSCYQK